LDRRQLLLDQLEEPLPEELPAVPLQPLLDPLVQTQQLLIVPQVVRLEYQLLDLFLVRSCFDALQKFD
jgi:hypothetical protein